MLARSAMKICAAALALSLSACGGGGTDFIPSPPTRPNVPPPPPPPPPTSQVPFGVTSDTEFATVGEDMQFRWDHEAQAYEVRFPGNDWERLAAPEIHPGQAIYYPNQCCGMNVATDSPYEYTNHITLFENGWGMPIGYVAYGQPTSPGDVPVTGSASYEAMVSGIGSTPNTWVGAYWMSGEAQLDFDFAAGTLSGYMQVAIAGEGSEFTAPRYDFTQTVFSVGSTDFSGSFIVPGSTADSSFSGLFTGPGAEELMAEWQAPFVDPNGANGPTWGTMSGIWIGRRGE